MHGPTCHFEKDQSFYLIFCPLSAYLNCSRIRKNNLITMSISVGEVTSFVPMGRTKKPQIHLPRPAGHRCHCLLVIFQHVTSAIESAAAGVHVFLAYCVFPVPKQNSPWSHKSYNMKTLRIFVVSSRIRFLLVVMYHACT